MISRRWLLERIGIAGELGAIFTAMQALGLMSTARAESMMTLPPQLGRGRHVIVLGAGISGLVAAYELEQAGFLVTLLKRPPTVALAPGTTNFRLVNGGNVIDAPLTFSSYGINGGYHYARLNFNF